ncbi:MAG TPA: lamin tail domain-containing protein [Pyrinomonadaceae bacterium]|nr:lamin tail domain-containing protein [Pyrinomonadaceae bacterium]
MVALALPSRFIEIIPSAQAASANIVISQVYGGGGNSQATYTHDFVELFNRGTAPAPLNGWSIQYTSATGTGNFGSSPTLITELPDVTLAPGQYLLVQEASNAAVGSPLPAPFVTDPTPIAMAGGAGKVALVNSSTPLGCNGSSTSQCTAAALASIVDLVGYGNANFFEGTGPAPALTNTTAAFRDDGGCVDTDNNGADFANSSAPLSPGTPNPRNTGTTLKNCGGTTQPTLSVGSVSVDEGNSGTKTVTVTVSLSAAAGTGGVTFNIATQDNSATIADNDYIAFNLVGESIAQGSTSKSYTATIIGDTKVEAGESFNVNVTGITGAANTSAQGSVTITNDDVTIVPINEIQGSDATSPLLNQIVTTTGIVTGKKAGTSGGIFIQTPDNAVDTDADAADTSEGLFVFTGSTVAAVNFGDQVRVTGRVTEFKRTGELDTLTQLSGTPAITVLPSDGTPPPAPLTESIYDPAAASRNAQLEKYEGMLVSVPSLTVTEPTNSFGEFYGVFTGPRPFRAPGIERGDPVPAADNGPLAGTPPPDVPRWDGNFELIMVDGDDQANAEGLRRPILNVNVGALVDGNITGPLDFAFDTYRISLLYAANPTVTGGITQAVPAPVRSPGEFTISSINLENFDDSASNFSTKVEKSSLVIRDVLRTPDILGVIEVADLTTLQALANKINADVDDSASVSYQPLLEEGIDDFFINGQNANRANDQDVGFLVNAARVRIISTEQFYKHKTFTFNNVEDVLHDRTPFLLEAEVPQEGTSDKLRVTVIVNHLKSLIEVDSPVTGARNREKRRLQAEDLADLIEARKSENLVVLGDMNAFQFNDGLVDVVGTLKGSPAPPSQVVEPSIDFNPATGGERWTYTLTDLVETLDPSQQYSFVFEGSAQVLDHMLVNDKMLARLERFAYARNNADFNEGLSADASRPERVSDHDAPVGYFSLPNSDLSLTKTAASGSVLSGADATYTVTVSNGSADAATNVVMTDQIPSGTTLSSENHPAGWTCATVSDGGGNKLQCTTPSMSGNSSAIFTMALAIDCATEDNTTITNTATVTTSSLDLDADNNSRSATATVSNPAPTIVAPADASYSCPSEVPAAQAADATVGDNCGTPTVTVTEMTNGGAGSTASPLVITRTYTATDSAGRSASDTQTITVIDATAPAITGVSVDKPVLTLPNHRMVDVTVNYAATDNCGGAVNTSLSVSSNEAVNGLGDGDAAPDWQLVDAHHVQLRAERSGQGNGRIYTITITATDGAGNTSTETVTVTVPKGH